MVLDITGKIGRKKKTFPPRSLVRGRLAQGDEGGDLWQGGADGVGGAQMPSVLGLGWGTVAVGLWDGQSHLHPTSIPKLCWGFSCLE